MNTYFVYILASKPYGTLYIGVTNSLLDRVNENRLGLGSKFTSRHSVSMLVSFEEFSDVTAAIQPEKSFKQYLRTLPGNAGEGVRGEMGPRDEPEDDSFDVENVVLV